VGCRLSPSSRGATSSLKERTRSAYLVRRQGGARRDVDAVGQGSIHCFHIPCTSNF
jgi:hypothetical protein